MVVVPKRSGDVRICVDLKPLNECSARGAPDPQGGRDLGLTHRSISVQQARCEQRVLANSVSQTIETFDDFHYSLWEVLFQQVAIWHI